MGELTLLLYCCIRGCAEPKLMGCWSRASMRDLTLSGAEHLHDSLTSSGATGA